MPNRPGHTFAFDYQESRGVNRTARLTSTSIEIDIMGVIQHATDPSWQVLRAGETKWNGDFDWLQYLGTDNKPWKTRVHCSAFAGAISTAFESERSDTGAGNNPSMRIVDWDGSQWTVVVDPGIDNAGGAAHKVGFTLSCP